MAVPWWRHQMETFSMLLVLCAVNWPLTGEFPAHRSVTRSFAVFFDLRLNKRFSKQPWGWGVETPSPSLWRHCNGPVHTRYQNYVITMSTDILTLNDVTPMLNSPCVAITIYTTVNISEWLRPKLKRLMGQNLRTTSHIMIHVNIFPGMINTIVFYHCHSQGKSLFYAIYNYLCHIDDMI